MAQFCSQCFTQYQKIFDIDLMQLALSCPRGQSLDFLCEGCYNRCIYKDEKGRLYLGTLNKSTNEIDLQSIEFDELVT